MIQLTADDIRKFRAAERVVLTEGAGLQTVACHTRARRGGRHYDTHEVHIEKKAQPANGGQPRRSLSLNRAQMAAWHDLSRQLRVGDRLVGLAWEDSGRLRRRSTVRVLVSRGGRLRPWPLGHVGHGPNIGMRPGRIALVAAAAAGLWWLWRHWPAVAVLAVTLLLLGLVVHRRRARDGWPLGTVRVLRFLGFLGITVMPLLLSALVVAGLAWAATAAVRWFRRTLGRSGPAAWWDRRSTRLFPPGSRDRRRPVTVVDLEDDGHGVHRTRPRPNGNTSRDRNVVPLAPANSREAYARHVDTAAKLLDVVGPGWETHVDPDELARTEDPGGHVLEAVFGGYDEGLRAVLDELAGKRPFHESPEERERFQAFEDCVRAALTGDTCTHIGNRPEPVHQTALREAWCDELARRARHGAPAS